MKYPEDSWLVLDKYFKSNHYFLTKHHLDSYNDFVTNKLVNTIKVLNPIVMLKSQDEGKLNHTVNIYIGGKDCKDVFLNKPTYDSRLLYPNEARLKDLTYTSDIFVNIVVEYITEEKGKPDRFEEEIFKNIKLGSLPIMLHSSICALNNQPPNILREMGECPYDQGGYFVIDGKEKVIVAQERIATNRIFINKSKDPNYTYEGLIRCTSEENPLFPKTTRLYIHENESITISIPYVDIQVPLFVAFRALGVETDKDILSFIMSDIESPENEKIIEFLRSSIISTSIYTQDDAFDYLKEFVEYKNIHKLKHILIYDLFPNVGNSFRNKALFLGHIIQKLVKTALGASKESDRDNYMFKRVDVSGFLVGNLFRDYYNQFRNAVRNKLDNEYLYGHWRQSKIIKNLVNKNNLFKIFRADIIEDGIRKSLKGMWGRSMLEEQQDMDLIKQGLVQDLSRISYLGTISHLRRVNTPLDPTAKIVEPHRLHTSQWGIMCPCESPDGGSIGLLKNMAIMCKVTYDSNSSTIMELLKDFENIKYLNDIVPQEVYKTTKILLNSNWFAITNTPDKLFRFLKLCKRNAIIDIYTSISWNVLQNEINILTESGRCCRPVFVVENNKLVIEEYLEKIKAGSIGFNDLFGSKPKMTKDLYTLAKTQSPLEYIDVEEANGSLIAMTPHDLIMFKKPYTHCEIHPSTLFSVVTHTIPLSNHNQAPRNIFSGAQGKQAIGWYATNFNNRIDTMSYMLNYPQKCLVNTRYMEYMNMNRMPNGENLIVALACYTGYNQEDAIVMNKTSVERGMFNLTYFKNIIDKEDENQMENERFEFCNPLDLANAGKMSKIKTGNYDKIDENGYPIINEYVTEGDVIVGKCKIKSTVVDEEGVNSIFGSKVKKDVYEDKSMVANKTVSGIIDKVYVYDDVRGHKTCKIRMRKTRTPELGDKCCCYDETTQILTSKGWKYFKDLIMCDKVATLVNDCLVYQHPSEIQSYDFHGSLIQVNNKHISLCVTDNHRMYVREKGTSYHILEASETTEKKYYYKKNANSWKPCLDGVPDELLIDNGDIVGFQIDGGGTELVMDIVPWLKFFGLWISHGFVNENLAHIAIIDHSARHQLGEVCRELGLGEVDYWDNTSWKVKNPALLNYLMTLGDNRYYAFPRWVWYLNRSHCRILLDTISRHKQSTSSSNLADDFQMLCVHAGYSAKKTYQNDMWQLVVNDKQNEPAVSRAHISNIPYTGKVWCCTVKNGEGVLYVRRKGMPVWCGNSRHAQKGTVGMLVPAENMPFTKNGIVPDIIINPNAIPSRMTVAHLLECLIGKYGAMKGSIIDGTPFDNQDYMPLFESLQKEFGLHKYGNEVMYCGMNGHQIQADIFIGPTYYERLKHMVGDKINYRSSGGQISMITRQPTKGRSAGAALRIGEMERDSILAHGIASFMKESYMERSDNFRMEITKGGIANKYDQPDNVEIRAPFAMKQMIQEVMSMGVKPIFSMDCIAEEEDENFEDASYGDAMLLQE